MSNSPLNQQEQDVVDTIGQHSLTAAEICQDLNWNVAKIYPVLAALVGKKVLTSQVSPDYPFTKYYQLRG